MVSVGPDQTQSLGSTRNGQPQVHNLHRPTGTALMSADPRPRGLS